MDTRKLTKDEVTILLPLTHNMCAMHDVPPTCENYRLVRGDHFFGELAHISAAKPGGQRYDPDMDPDERDGVTNRIVLCPNHHTIIDKKDNTYTSEQLRQIKANHEGQSHLPLLNASDAAIDEAVAAANFSTVNNNNNSGEGVQQVSTMNGTADLTSFNAARDLTIIYSNVPVIATPSPAPLGGFYQPKRTVIIKAEVTWMNLDSPAEDGGDSYGTSYLAFDLDDKRFVIATEELARITRDLSRDRVTGTFIMGAGEVVSILDVMHLVATEGLHEHTFLNELRELCKSGNLHCAIITNDKDIRAIPFGVIDAISAQCSNSVKLMFGGDRQ